ncbi:MAG: T9SS type A sorting domain-containing protein [Bacteroidota bacterium]
MKTKLLIVVFCFLSFIVNAQVGYISTIAGTGVEGHTGDGGPATAAKLGITFGIVFDAAGNIIFADNGNNAIRKITTSSGIINKIAGTYYTYNGTNWYYGGDGGLATSAYMAYPFGVALDTAGNIYIADNLNNVIRKVTVSTGIITTVAGDGTIFQMPWPFCGDGGQATDAQLNDPWGVAVDKAGNIYIADRGNNVIRKVTASTGIISTVAGNGTAGYTGNNGLATAASLNGPDGITLDSAGNMYISDQYNNVIRKVTKSTGIITTIAGNGTAGFSGDNGLATSAQLNDPSLGIAFDAAGNFYIADDGNSRIRKVTVATGIITTVAGNGTFGYSGDNGPATSAALNGPEGVGVDALGNIYITDENNVIRKVNGPGGSVPATPGAITGNATLCYGSSITYSVTAVNGATSYNWTLPSGWTGTSTTNSITTTAVSSGTISVTANNSFGSSTPRTLNVTVNTVNTALTQVGTTLTATASGAGYQWLNCNGYSIIAGQSAQSYTASASGSYAVIVTQNGCADTSECYPVYIGGPPPIPAQIIGNTTVCFGTTNTYSVDTVSGATSYTWTLPSGWSGTSTTNSINAVATTSGTITVTANNSFGSSVAQTLYVTVNVVDVTVTQNASTLLANATGATYQWIDCNGFVPLTGQTYQSFTAVNPGNYAVIVSKNGCVDTSNCFTTNFGCGITITGADLPHDGLSVMLAVDTLTNVSLGTAAPGQVWNYSNLSITYPKYAEYHLTSSTPYASTFPNSNIETYGPGNLYGSLFGGAPVGPGNGYCFWKSDTTGFWVMGFRPESGSFSGTNVQNTPPELVIGAPATYGSMFTAFGRWELPMNQVSTNVDTFYVRTIKKQIIADACGSLTTPHGTYPNVLREHEFITEIDSVFGRFMGTTYYSTEYLRDSANTYTYLAPGIGYPVCTVHADKNNVVKDVEYFNGIYTGIENKPVASEKLTIYPNPTDKILNIEMPKHIPAIEHQIHIYNSIGSLVWQKNTLENKLEINISTYPKGMYLVEIISGNSKYSQKIIKN